MKRFFIVLVFILFLTSCKKKININNEYGYTYSCEGYVEYNEFISNNNSDLLFEELNLDWVSGEVIIENGDSFNILEKNIEGNYLPLYCKVCPTSFNVKYCKSGTSDKKISDSNKQLVITIPNSCLNLNLSLISSNYKIKVDNVSNIAVDGISCDGDVNASIIEKFNCSTISGNTNITAFKIENIDVSSTRNNVIAKVDQISNVHFSAISGNIDLRVADSSLLEVIDLSTTSGNANLKLDGIRGYDLDFDSVSGNKRLDFVNGSDEEALKFKIIFSSVSGDLDLKKL